MVEQHVLCQREFAGRTGRACADFVNSRVARRRELSGRTHRQIQAGPAFVVVCDGGCVSFCEFASGQSSVPFGGFFLLLIGSITATTSTRTPTMLCPVLNAPMLQMSRIAQ